MRRLLAACLIAAAAPAAVAQTPAVDRARSAGQVGERYDGYIGMVVSDVPTALRNQVGSINIRRRALYNNLAVSRRVAPQEVGIAAGCQLLAGVRAGESYLLPDGVWRRRAAGQPVALPGYCRRSR